MGRRIYIIPKSMKVDDAKEEAKRLGCPEIVKGVPPILKKIIKTTSLPMVYEEPEPGPSLPPRDAIAELDDLNARLTEKGIL